MIFLYLHNKKNEHANLLFKHTHTIFYAKNIVVALLRKVMIRLLLQKIQCIHIHTRICCFEPSFTSKQIFVAELHKTLKSGLFNGNADT